MGGGTATCRAMWLLLAAAVVHGAVAAVFSGPVPKNQSGWPLDSRDDDEPITRVNYVAPPPHAIPWPAEPAEHLPNLDGTGYPGYRVVFQHGECTADDAGNAGDHPINVNKTCFSCFRIPTLLGGQTPGVIHAFAEARRGELTSSFHGPTPHSPPFWGGGGGTCPDCPDTRLAYKRSENNGATWSPIKIFLQHQGNPSFRAENGQCQSQAAPFIDPDTKTLYVAFNQDGPGCVGSFASSRPMLVNSTDDGLSWSKPYYIMLNLGNGKPPVPAGAHGYAVGPTKGLTVRLSNGGIRLMIPGENAWSASVFSDDHGKTWNSNAGNRSLTLSPGEMDWTPCVSGTRCPKAAKFVMINRAGGKINPEAVGVSYSRDSVTWTREIQANNGDLVAGHGHAKPGIVAVAPGCFISSQIISLCKKGLKANPDMSCGTPGSANYTKRKPDDVLNYGMGLLISKDGTNWTLFKKTWPIQGMYTTAAALSVNAEGAALTYGIVFAAGSLPTSKTGTIYFMNFTAVHPNGTVDAELAAALGKL